jgi:hypothetical protein
MFLKLTEMVARSGAADKQTVLVVGNAPALFAIGGIVPEAEEVFNRAASVVGKSSPYRSDITIDGRNGRP